MTGARAALIIFAASCLAIFLFFWAGSLFVSTPHADIVPLRLPSWDEAKWWIGRPDTGFYIDIAENGYKRGPYSAAEGTNWAFFPAYPLLLRAVAHGRTAEAYLAAGFLLSLLFYGMGVWSLARLLLLDYDGETVGRAVLLLCFYPFAFSLAVFGPDSLCLATACAALYYGRRSRWMVAAAIAAVACASRVQGVLVVPCLLLMAWRQRDRSAWPVLLSPLSLVAFSAHLWQVTGNPLAFIGIQRAWNNSPSCPFAFVTRYLQAPVLIGNSGWDPEALSVLVTLGTVAMLVWAARARTMRPEYLLFFGLQVVVLTCRTSTLGNLRYVTGCFPFFLGSGLLTRRPLVFGAAVAFSAALFGLFAALFAAGQQHHPGYHFVAF